MKMREQHEMLVQASKFSSLGEMAGEIAHEINTPLAAIMLNVELLSEIECANPEEQIEADRLIKSTSETVARISQIVKGLRSFARDANHEPMVLVSLASIVEDTLALCSPKFKTGRVKIEPFKIDPEFMIECRPVQISQVLLNLLSNAYDAVETLPERWIRIELSDQGESFELAVVDSGPGVNEVLRKRIMEPFFTTKPAGKGTGLGLSISAGILNSHRGGLSVDAACANTRFVMTLPKRQPQALSA
jgi:C4-dicarboxylate-specific signal transduction histidine kinase